MGAVDSGFLFALDDRRDRWHSRAMSFAGTSAEGWVCTWPVLSEACRLLLRELQPRFAIEWMDDAARGALEVWSPPAGALGRVGMLMAKHADLPMDLADASLVLPAEPWATVVSCRPTSATSRPTAGRAANRSTT